MLDPKSVNYPKDVKVAIENLDYISRQHTSRLEVLEMGAKAAGVPTLSKEATLSSFALLDIQVADINKRLLNVWTASSHTMLPRFAELEQEVRDLKTDLKTQLRSLAARAVPCIGDDVTADRLRGKEQLVINGVPFKREYVEGAAAALQAERNATWYLRNDDQKVVSTPKTDQIFDGNRVLEANKRLAAKVADMYRVIEQASSFLCQPDLLEVLEDADDEREDTDFVVGYRASVTALARYNRKS